jgi:hypothetical protein
MNVKTARIAGFVVAIFVGLGTSSSWADSLCPERSRQAAADAQVKQAEDLERAGKVREAYTAAGKADGDCVSDYKRHEALKKRAARAIAADEEKKGRFADAFDWYERGQSIADAGRMQRKLVETNPDDVNTVSRAIDFFVRQQDSAQEKALRAHALNNVEKALAAEEKQFAAVTRDSLQELGLARDWSSYAKAGLDRVRARAGKRGDILAAEDGRKFMNLALRYYAVAGDPAKELRVREKARVLARQYEGKGEGEIAAEYYEIAGDSGRASAVRKQTEAREQQTEDSRKKTFKKGQQDLEKSLGF